MKKFSGTVYPASGAVICFVIYLLLCGQIVTLLESHWLIIPSGVQYSFNKVNNDGTIIQVKSNSTAVGSCGLVGMCYPFLTGAVLEADIAVEYEPCHMYQDKSELGGQAGMIAISLYGVGLGMLTVSWCISICSCCNDTICGKNVFLLLTHFITLSFLLVGGGSVTWMFTWHDESCATIYCSATPLFKNNCLFGWSLWVLSCVLVGLFITMLVLCAATRRQLAVVKPKLRRLPIQVVERAGNNTGFMFASVADRQAAGFPSTCTSGTGGSDRRSTARFPRGGPGVYGSVRLKEFYF